MSVIKVHKKSRAFVSFYPDCLYEKSLSWNAKGLFAYLMSKPTGWKINISHLVKEGKAGRDKIYNIINELIEFGYVQKFQNQDPLTKRFTGIEYVIFEEKTSRNAEPLPESPEMEKPFLENPDTAQPDLENPTLVKSIYSNKEIREEEAEERGNFPDWEIKDENSSAPFFENDACIGKVLTQNQKSVIGGLAANLRNFRASFGRFPEFSCQ